ncbi:hypothetical protein Val02_54790 [Virgisporangium aliadipatigenens]|uniref:Peptidase MA superfamily protein n=1 Tax=Virgisporangium aliadipatigenens TaxID=741659 RepID=A0A8J3YRV3_9ACTN|nr:hypothetical protein Val02_54790 [Virgisporangium aliadipatigenens]
MGVVVLLALVGGSVSAAGATPVRSAPVGARAAVAGPSPSASSAPVSVRDLFEVELAKQATAITTGDVRAYLRPADPALHDRMLRIYGSLRAMKAVAVTMTVSGSPQRVTEGQGAPIAGGQPFGGRRGGDNGPPDGRWRATVELSFCAAADGCVRAPTKVQSEWTVTGTVAKLVAYPDSTDRGPRPWEASDLRAAVGERVVVAGTSHTSARLPAVLETAEKAAKIADRYARWRPAPTRYMVYLADPEDWAKWYGGKQAAWVAGFAMPLAPDYTEIVLNATRVDAAESLDTLTHEFAHVTTLAGVSRNYSDTWVLVEGVAEFAAHAGEDPRKYRWLDGTRTYVRSGQWPGTAALSAPAESASVGDATGRYGVAYLAVRRIADRFGEDRMWSFFEAVVRSAESPERAAPRVLGAEWSDVAADCDASIRSLVN